MYVAKTNSTNSLLEQLDRGYTLPDGFCLYTYNQTEGRGQMGNQWESERGQNLLLSVLMRPTQIAVSEQFILSQQVAVAVARTALHYTDGISIKWPNDIYWHERKLAGILIENSLAGTDIKRCIAGIGLNVNQTTFRSDAPNPVSLAQIVGHSFDKKRILKELLDNLAHMRTLTDTPDLVQRDYFRLLYRREGFYNYRLPNGEQFSAQIITVHPDGVLELELPNGERKLFYFKEVQFII